MERPNERELREVPDVQAQVHDGDSCAGAIERRYIAAPRLLQEPSGTWRLYRLKRAIATAEDVRVSTLQVPRLGASCTRYQISRLYWDQAYGLLQLQGAGPRDLIGPNYLILRAKRGRAIDPRPHLRELDMVVVHRAAKGTDLLALFEELQRRIK